MSEQHVEKEEKVTPESATHTTASDEKEQALLRTLMQQLQEKKDQGVQLPTAIVTPATTPLEENKQPEDVVMVQEVEKKRKAVNYPEPDGGTDVVVPKEPVEPQTKVPRTEVTPAKAKVTLEKLLTMKVDEIDELDSGQLADIEMGDLIKANASTAIKNAVRLRKSSSAQKQKAEKEEGQKQREADLEAFNKVRHKISLEGNWNKHYSGTGRDDWRFTKFLNQKGYSTADLIDIVVKSSALAGGQHCQFMNPAYSHHIFKVEIDLGGFFGDELLKGMNITAGVTGNNVIVYHAGPRD
jgi:hypothetical protein